MYLYIVSVLTYEELDDRVMDKLSEKPSYFSEKMLGIKLHWYQILVIDDPHPDKVMCWSRQIGKSTMVAIYVVWYIFTHENSNILILSQDRDASRRFYNLVISYILSNPLLADSIIGEALQSGTKFKNGTFMINKAPGRTGKSTRGDSIHLLIVDEADFIEEEVFDAAEQTTSSTDGAIILISTPNKKGSTFYQYFTDGMLAHRKAKGEEKLEEDDDPDHYVGHPAGSEFGFKAYHFDYKIGLGVNKPDGKPQLSIKKVNRMRKKRAHWKFQQEYEAVWAEDTASYFRSQVILDAIDESYEMKYHGDPNRVYYMGVDFAKHIDKTVCLIGELQDDGRVKIVYIYEVQGRNWVDQQNELMEIGKRFNIIRAYLDGTGVGDAMFDVLNGVASPMYNKCERIVFTMPTKNGVYQNLSNLLNAGRIIIPQHKQFVDELMFLQYEKMEGSQYVKIHDPRGMHTIGDDYPDALALLGLGMSKNLIIGKFTGYVVHKRYSSYPNFWEADHGDEGAPVGAAIGLDWMKRAGAKITKSKTTNQEFGRIIRGKKIPRKYVNRFT